MNQKKSVDLNHLCHILFESVCHSCLLLSQFKDFEQVVWKDSSNPVTEVDYLIQDFLSSSINSQLGELYIKIVGEEDLSFSQLPDLQSLVHQKLKTFQPTTHHSFHPEVVFNQRYYPQELNLWIDPIDCTAGFTNKSFYQVTILVGVSYKSKPICGFIAHPFKRMGDKDYYDPTVIFGSTELSRPCSYEYHINSDSWSILRKPEQDSRKTLISCRCICEKQESLMKAMQLQPVREGGSGYKCLRLIKNEASSVLLLNLTSSKWDTCAGQAIVLAMGGFAIKPTLEPIDYSNTEITSNNQGFFMTTNEAIFKNFLKAMQDIQKDKEFK